MSKREEIDNKQNFVSFDAWLRNRQMEAHRACERNSQRVSSEEQAGINLDKKAYYVPGTGPIQDKKPYFVPETGIIQEKKPYFAPETNIGLDKKPYFWPKTVLYESSPSRKTSKAENSSNKNVSIRGLYEEFSNDFLSLLNDTSCSDIEIKSGGENLKVHKAVLSARSPVFKAMFSSSMRESAEGAVAIDDLMPEVVRDLIFFIYSNEVQNLSVPKACDLLDAAEKYQLHSLKRICVDFLISSLSVENAFLILQTSDLYDKNLKMRTMKFISEKFSDLKMMEEWKSMQSHNPTLALEVFNVVVEHFT